MSVLLEGVPSSENIELLACRGCLATDTELHDLNEKGCAQFFGDFTGVSVTHKDGYPHHICSICVVLLRKCLKFRHRCVTAMCTLQQMNKENQIISTDTIKSIERNKLQYNLHNSVRFNLDIDDKNVDESVFKELVESIDQILHDDSSDEEFNKTKDKRRRAHKKKRKAETKTVGNVQAQDFNTSDDEFLIKEVGKEQEMKEEDVDDEIVFEELNENCEVNFEDLGAVGTELTHFVKIEREGDDWEIPDEIVTKDKKKNKKAKSKTLKTQFEVVSDEGIEINDDWKKIVDEINEEIASNKIIKRKVPTLFDIQRLMRQADKFSKAYNAEVRYLSKEEQQCEIEQKRRCEEFVKAAFKCQDCAKTFTSQETFATHCLVHDMSNGEYVCEICRYRFRTRLPYMRHFLIQHTKKMTCRDCGQVNRSWTKAKEHYLWHQGTHLDITCEQCGIRFALRKNYLMHVRNKHGGRADGPECLLCDRPFFNASGLHVHTVKTHKHEPRCSSCGVVFASADTLGVHLNAAQGCQPGHSSCPKCGHNFTTENEMRTHYNEVHRKNHYKCEQCNKSFDGIEKYSLHMKYHNWRSYSDSVQHSFMANEPTDGPTSRSAPRWRRRAEKRFCCEICGKEKPCMALLREHQLVHTDQTPFQCDYCQKRFKFKQYLRTHIRTHTGERKYKCSMCPKAFRQYSHRTVHILTHTQEKPHECSVCGKCFSVRTNLSEHSRTVHAGLPPRRRKRAPRATDGGIGNYC